MTGRLSADLHDHAIEFIMDGDRRWFLEHPFADSYCRPAGEHELCDPRRAPECIPRSPTPPALSGLRPEPYVEVRQLAPGVRTRSLYWVLVPDGRAA